MRIRVSGKGRAAALGVMAAMLAACASEPVRTYRAPAPASVAQITPPLRPPAAPSVDGDFSFVPFDASNAPRVAYDGPPSECVPFARAASGVAIFGDAVTWWAQADGRYPRSSTPAEGSVFVMRGYSDDKRGHVAVVEEVVSPRLIRIDQANWLHEGEISYRVPVLDVSVANDWSQVRVWYVPDNHWGGRVYEADGFIHPIPLLSPSNALTPIS